MDTKRIVLKSKSNFLSIPTGSIISVCYHGGMTLEIAYKTEANLSVIEATPRLAVMSSTKAATFFFAPFEKKQQQMLILNFAAK
jgi:hypothetical protein